MFPSAPYRPRSPVQYSISPLSLATLNFSFVFASSFQYPLATPSPPMQISPLTHIGAASPSSFLTSIRWFLIGFPYGMLFHSRLSSSTSYITDQIEHSVAPPRLTTLTPSFALFI